MRALESALGSVAAVDASSPSTSEQFVFDGKAFVVATSGGGKIRWSYAQMGVIVSKTSYPSSGGASVFLPYAVLDVIQQQKPSREELEKGP